MLNPYVAITKSLLKEAEEAEQEVQAYEEACQKDPDVLNDWEAQSSASFAEGKASGIRQALRELGL